MKEKKTGSKFTILFSQANPIHIQAADILNRQPQRGKAHYIATAILHYENRNDAQPPPQVDEKSIEAVVSRLLRNRQESGASEPFVFAPDGQGEKMLVVSTDSVSEIYFDDAAEALGEDGFDAVANALDMFRRK